jgi:glutathione S-transferase
MITTPASVLSAAVTILAVVVYLATGMVVGRMRAAHHIVPPAVTGAPEFERAYRVQLNTLEQLAVFLPLLWIATACPVVIGWLAPALGLVWVIGRVLYMRGYLVAAEKRSLGFNIAAGATLALLVLSVIGVVMRWVAFSAAH